VVLALAVIIAGFAVVMYKQKAVGLSTGMPSQLSQEKNAAEVEENTKAKWGGLPGYFAEDAG